MTSTNVTPFRRRDRDSALDRRAQLAARKAGYRAIKSTEPESYDNQGGYMLIDARTDRPVAGFHFNLTAGEVVEFCSE